MAAETNVASRLIATGGRDLSAIRKRARAMLNAMEISPERHSDLLSTFSGGMKQRVQLSRALVAPPQLLLLDEPTTGLDPSVQAVMLELVADVIDRTGAATVLVSHDLGVVRVLADRVIVLRYGRVVEEGLARRVLEEPQHPYTQLLVASRVK
jgi:ABC-type phosphonate transport system ATPase subunit